MPKGPIYTAILVFLTTAVVWIVGVSSHTFLVREFWLYAGFFLIPATLVCGCSWLIFHGQRWRRAIGMIMLVPCLGIWILSLMLVYSGFKIH